MLKKHITLKSIDLFYVEINESANQTIFFIHGNSGSHKTWKLQLNDPGLAQYRLIAFDLPGHGNSSLSNKPAVDYSPLGTAEILTEAIKSLHLNKPFILIGFSYGTNLIAEIINNGLQPAGIVTIGMCCIGGQYGMDKVFKQDDQPSIFFYNEDNTEKIQNFLRQTVNEKNIKEVSDDYLRVDKMFRPSLMQAAADGKISDEIVALKKMNIAVCVILGLQDNLVNIDYLDGSDFPLWKERINKFEGGHFIHFDAPGKVNSVIAEYAKERFTPTHV